MTARKTTRVTSSDVNVDDVVFSGVLSFLGRQGSWTGTMTDLSSGIVRTLGKKNSSVLPRSPSALRTVLNRVVNRLRNRKISVKFGRTTDHTRTRYVRFAR